VLSRTVPVARYPLPDHPENKRRLEKREREKIQAFFAYTSKDKQKTRVKPPRNSSVPSSFPRTEGSTRP